MGLKGRQEIGRHPHFAGNGGLLPPAIGLALIWASPITSIFPSTSKRRAWQRS